MIREAGGPACVCGVSSGAALALDAAARELPIERLALYEPPFIVDDTRPPITDADARQMRQHVDDREHGAAVAHFMRLVGVPRMGVLMMRMLPMWPKLKAVAPTLPARPGHHRAATGRPAVVGQTEWASVTAPTVVIAGGKSPAWMRNSNAALRGKCRCGAPGAARPDAHNQGQGAGTGACRVLPAPGLDRRWPDRRGPGRHVPDTPPVRQVIVGRRLGVGGVHRLRFR